MTTATPEQEVLDEQTTQRVTATAIESINRAEIDMQIETAKRWPRDIRTFKQRATEMACLDQETAAGCMYALPRGGKNIEGPSVRLAEIIVSTWGNLRAGTRIVHEDDRFITAQAVCHDLEANTAITVEVRRRITDRHERKYKDDMIGVTANAASSIALRNAVFKVVPMAFTKEIYADARKAAIGDATTLSDRRQKMVEYFGKMGVVPDRVFAAVGKENIDQIGLDELATLQGVSTAIRQGDTTVDEAFLIPVADDKGGKGFEARRKAAKKSRSKSKDEAGAEVKADPSRDAPATSRRQELLDRVMSHTTGVAAKFTKEVRGNFDLGTGKLLVEDFADYKDSDLVDLLAALESK